MASQDWFEKDFYKTLGVSKDISDADLKKTYRKLARKYHPDSNQGAPRPRRSSKRSARRTRCSATPSSGRSTTRSARWARARRASPPAARARASRTCSRSSDRAAAAPARVRRTSTTSSRCSVSSPVGGFGSGRFGQTSGGFRGYGGPTRGADVTARTTVDFLTATRGETITLQGEDGKPFKVKIPAGVSDGQKIRLRGRGRPSPDGGETGDIVVQVNVRPHPVFTREGSNLRVIVPVTFTEAALGATIEVPTLGGDPVKLRVAPGTPSGRVLRVKGRGVETAKGTGDLLAEVQVAVPAHLDEAAREALERFRDLEPKENPRAELMAKSRG